jgi:glutamate racemase
MDRHDMPVGVFDSGAGGISVLQTMVRLMPEEDFLFFGDDLHAPYGTRSTEEVRALAEDAVRLLLSRGAKAVVIACNTATSAAAGYLREKFPDVPIIGMEPALKPAAEAGEHPRVLVMATPLTIREEKLRALSDKLRDKADFVFVPCHGLVEAVECGDVDGDGTLSLVTEILEPRLDGVDSIVLGCTNYAHVRGLIAEVAGPGVMIFDGAAGTARETERRLREADLLTDSEEKGGITLLSSSRDPDYSRIMEKLLAGQMEK